MEIPAPAPAVRPRGRSPTKRDGRVERDGRLVNNKKSISLPQSPRRRRYDSKGREAILYEFTTPSTRR